MKISVANFILKGNKLGEIEDRAYQGLSDLIDGVAQMAHLSHCAVYIKDHYKGNFLYVSNNDLFCCGEGSTGVKLLGYEHLLHRFDETELTRMVKYEQAFYDFLRSVDRDTWGNYCMEYDTKIINAEGQEDWVHYSNSPLRWDKEGALWLSLCSLSYAPASVNRAGVYIYDRERGYQWSYNQRASRWSSVSCLLISPKERRILKLSYQGYSNEDIAKEMKYSVCSIKKYKTAIFEKLGVTNITEAILFALNNHLLGI